MSSALSLLLCNGAAQANPQLPEGMAVERVVILMRHGLTSNPWVDHPAPSLQRHLTHAERIGVPLTEHGRLALDLWGRHHRQRLAQQGLLPERGALTARHVSVFTGPLQRTRASAEAFLEGLSPRAGLRVTLTGARGAFDAASGGLDSAVNVNAARHARFVGVQQGSRLLALLSESLFSMRDPQTPSVMVYVGHDLNMASVRAILGFDWGADECLRHDNAPGGMLIFERILHAPSGRRFLRLSYHAPTTDQLRYLQPFHEAARPVVRVFHAPVTLDPVHQIFIPQESFLAMVGDVLDDLAEGTQRVAGQIPSSSSSPTPTITNDTGHTTRSTRLTNPILRFSERNHVAREDIAATGIVSGNVFPDSLLSPFAR